MSRDTAVLTVKEERIAPEDILAKLESRGISLEWKHRSPSKFAKSSEWKSGTFFPRGEPDSLDRVPISVEEVDDFLREETLEDISDGALRAVIETARWIYRVSVPGPAAERDRILAHLIDVVAELGGGVILGADGEVVSLAEYRSRDRWLQAGAAKPGAAKPGAAKKVAKKAAKKN